MTSKIVKNNNDAERAEIESKKSNSDSADERRRGSTDNGSSDSSIENLEYNEPPDGGAQVSTFVLHAKAGKGPDINVTPLPFSPVQFQYNCYFNGRN